MSNAWLAEFDAIAFPAFAGSGLADSAEYTPAAGGTATPCTVMVDLAVQRPPGQFAGAGRDRITFMLAEVEPESEGTLVIGSTSYVLFELDSADESASSWWVAIGTSSAAATWADGTPATWADGTAAEWASS